VSQWNAWLRVSYRLVLLCAVMVAPWLGRILGAHC
jgi:hypothetical protein